MTAASSPPRVGDRKTQSVPDAPEQIILDGNQLAEGQAFFAIGATDISDDGRWLAYTTDPPASASTPSTSRISKPAKPSPANSSASAPSPGPPTIAPSSTPSKTKSRSASSNSSATPSAHAPRYRCPRLPGRRRALQHRRGPHPRRQVHHPRIRQPHHQRVPLPLRRPANRRLPLISPAKTSTSTPSITATATCSSAPTIAAATSASSPRPSMRPRRENWTERIPHRDSVMLEDIDLFANFFVACEREDGLPRLRLWTFQDETAEAASRWRNRLSRACLQRLPRHQSHLRNHQIPLRLRVARLAGSVYRVRPRHPRESMLLKQQEVPGGFDRTLYASERIHATAPDGVKVPISLVYRERQARARADNPLYVYGYGSYGYSLPLGFNSNRLSLLDRGIVMAYAHIRGGGDLGKPWHDAGKMLVKRNTFTDFIAVVEHLTAAGLRRPHARRHRRRLRRRTAHGRRHQPAPRPLPRRPLPRPLRRRHEHHARRVASPHRPRIRRVGRPQPGTILPLHAQLLALRQPEAGKLSGHVSQDILNDSQVMYWEPAKYVAKLRTLKTDATRSSSSPTWKPATAAPAAATTTSKKSPSTTPSSSASWELFKFLGFLKISASQTSSRRRSVGKRRA